jgi:crotonobetainyl-CoA:carnitine CoA-transferase CaiB-like acyl-CoA transferase
MTQSLHHPDDLPLSRVRVVSLATNIPGPVAAGRLSALGATVTKVEPPSGDPVETVSKSYYDELVAGQAVRVLDLKDNAGRRALEALLTNADLLITSSRTAALERLGLGWKALHERHPLLSQVAIVGHPAPHDNRAGHDLTYQAANGMLAPPSMPSVLVADLSGAERAVSEGLAALVQRASTGAGSRREVALSVAAEAMAAPIRHELTTASGVLGGRFPAYGIYAAADGHVALAALEPHFFARLCELLAVTGSRSELEAVFATRSALQWQEWAEEHDVPLAAIASRTRDRTTT